MTLSGKKTVSAGAEGVPFFTPAQIPPAGTVKTEEGVEAPAVFTPLNLRGLTLQNRFAVSPMCMYSADDGHLTDFHLVHLGAYAQRGVALTIIEATAVTANGRISPDDSGIWKDSHVAPVRRIVDFIHSQGQKVGIQLAHAGRKASCISPWLRAPGQGVIAGPEHGGWPDNVWAPSAIPFNHEFPSPKEMSIAEIESCMESWAAAAKRSVEAGVDVIEIHAAHGYLFCEFLSPLSNKRTDKYGGSFENRARFLLDTIKAIRAVIPDTMPLFLRVSATEWMEGAGEPSWDIHETIKLARLLPDLGVDLLDVSSGGNSGAQKIGMHTWYQINLAGQIRAALQDEGRDLKLGAVGNITTAELARSVVQGGKLVGGPSDGTVEVDTEAEGTAKADLVLIARQFLREPEFVLRTAHHLGVQVAWPLQYRRAAWQKDAQL